MSFGSCTFHRKSFVKDFSTEVGRGLTPAPFITSMLLLPLFARFLVVKLEPSMCPPQDEAVLHE